MITGGQDNGSSQSSSSSSTGNAPSSSTSPPNGSGDPSGSGSPAVPPPIDDVSANDMNVIENINEVVGPESRKTVSRQPSRTREPRVVDAHRHGRSAVDPSSTWGRSQTAAGQRDDANKPDQPYEGGPPAGSSNTYTQRAAALPIASSTPPGPLSPRAPHDSDSETQHGAVTGPDQISSSNSPRPSKQSRRERTAHIPRADRVHRAPSAQSPSKSSSVSESSPALHRQSFSMSSFSPPLVEPVLTKTSKRTRTPWGMPLSDLQVATGGGVLSHTPSKRGGAVLPGEQSDGNPTAALDNVSPLSNHTPSREEPDSEHNPSSQAPPMVRDNSSFTRNEGTGYNPKESIEKKNTVEQRRNASLDERNGSKPGIPGNDAYQAQHRQTKPVSRLGGDRDRTPYTAPSPNSVQPSVSRRELPHNPIQRNDSGSPHAHNTYGSLETHKYLPEVPLTESPSAGPSVSNGYPPAPPPSASLNGDYKVSSSSDLATPALTAGRGGTHTNLQPVQPGYHPPSRSRSQPTVSIQPSPQPLPSTKNQHKPPNTESAQPPRRRGWAFVVRCDCIRA